MELRFHSLYTPSIQTQLASIIYENPLSDIPSYATLFSFTPPLAEVRFALRFLYVVEAIYPQP